MTNDDARRCALDAATGSDDGGVMFLGDLARELREERGTSAVLRMTGETLERVFFARLARDDGGGGGANAGFDERAATSVERWVDGKSQAKDAEKGGRGPGSYLSPETAADKAAFTRGEESSPAFSFGGRNIVRDGAVSGLDEVVEWYAAAEV